TRPAAPRLQAPSDAAPAREVPPPAPSPAGTVAAPDPATGAPAAAKPRAVPMPDDGAATPVPLPPAPAGTGAPPGLPARGRRRDLPGRRHWNPAAQRGSRSPVPRSARPRDRTRRRARPPA